jgi:DNA-binding transcriptional LysR family regulator
MRFKKLDLNLLVALDALLLDESISRAAERLHMSQSAMSNALARLREYFADELLMQVGRRMEPTPRALALKSAVRDVLLRVDTTIAIQPEFDPTQSDRAFRLFVSDYSLSVLMPHVMAVTAEQGATVRFDFLPQVDQPQRSLELGEVDLLIIPSSYCSPDHPSQVLFEETFCCLVWSGSKFAKAKEMTFEAYTAAGHVVMQPPGGQPSFETWFMQRYGVSRRVEVTTYNFSATPLLVVNTERVATVHKRLATLAARSAPLAMLEPPVPMPAMEQAMQWPRYRSQDPGLEWLRNTLVEATARMDQAGGRAQAT